MGSVETEEGRKGVGHPLELVAYKQMLQAQWFSHWNYIIEQGQSKASLWRKRRLWSLFELLSDLSARLDRNVIPYKVATKWGTRVDIRMLPAWKDLLGR